MTDYPNDILKAATAAYDADYIPAITQRWNPTAHVRREVGIEIIARAIMAERQRAANHAANMEKYYAETKADGRVAAGSILMLIRSGIHV